MLKTLQISILLLSISLSSALSAEIKFEYTTKSPIYVVGDIHGAYNEIHTTLRTTGLIDNDNNWSGGTSHFVSLGDMLDRGPSSRKVIDLYMKLQKQALDAGGMFHIVLGNHEVMILTGDLRYLSEGEYAEFAQDETEEDRKEAYDDYIRNSFNRSSDNARQLFNQKYPKGYFAHKKAFSSTGKYGQWLLELPFIIKINDQLFVHGGLSADLLGTTVEKINNVLKQSLLKYVNSWESLVSTEDLGFELGYGERETYVRELNRSKYKDSFLSTKDDYLFSVSTPTWYRGNSMCHPYFETDALKAILEQWDATRLWVGHTPTPSRTPNHRLNDQLIIMDTGMLNSYYGGNPWAAKIENDNALEFINGLTGVKKPSIRSPNRNYKYPYGLSEEQIKHFLKTADIIDEERTEFGVTKPIKLTLQKDGMQMNGVYKYLDTSPKAEKMKWTKKKGLADRYQYEMAAYTLDRLIGIGLVPITVEREIRGRKGIVQLWINDLTSKLVMNRNNLTYSGYCEKKAQVNLINTWDYLILNTDRNHSNILYSKLEGQIWFIDHSRAFGTSVKQLAKDKKWIKITPTETFKEALKKIKREDLKVLRPWLHRNQVNALWRRLNRIVEDEIEHK